MAAAADELQEELAAYFALRERWAADPVCYAIERLGLKPTTQQRQILDPLAHEGAMVSVRSGHNTGKTGAVSAAVWWFLETREFSKIPCTAPTSHQLKDVLWSELAKWLRQADDLARRRGIARRFWLSNLFRLINDRIYDYASPEEWYAAARTSGRNNADALQGFHADNLEVSEDGTALIRSGDSDVGRLMFVIDEAGGVLDETFEVAEGALASPGSRLIMTGNPTKTVGFFYRSHHADRAEYTCVHLKSQDSPLCSPGYRDRLVRKYGEGSNVVRIRADGEFPRQEDNVLISLEWAEPALDRDAYDERGSKIYLGVDPARFGDDRTGYVVRQGRNVPHIEVSSKQDTMVTARQAWRIVLNMGVDVVFVDVSGGLGTGPADRLREMVSRLVEEDRAAGVQRYKYPHIVDVNVSETAPLRSRVNASEDRESCLQGKTMRDYLWLEGAEWFRTQAPSFAGANREHAEDLVGEASVVRYDFDSAGKVVVESKKDMKKPERLGFSPDLMDALNCTFYPVTLGTISPISITCDGDSPWVI